MSVGLSHSTTGNLKSLSFSLVCSPAVSTVEVISSSAPINEFWIELFKKEWKRKERDRNGKGRNEWGKGRRVKGGKGKNRKEKKDKKAECYRFFTIQWFLVPLDTVNRGHIKLSQGWTLFRGRKDSFLSLVFHWAKYLYGALNLLYFWLHTWSMQSTR